MKRSPDPPERATPDPMDEYPNGAAADESGIDQILADSFPASDAPPWTLGVAQSSHDKIARKRNRGIRR